MVFKKFNKYLNLHKKLIRLSKNLLFLDFVKNHFKINLKKKKNNSIYTLIPLIHNGIHKLRNGLLLMGDYYSF